MNPFNDFFNDGRPFAIDACGDTMWDDVLNQSETTDEHRSIVDSSKTETTRINDAPLGENDRPSR
ncbi:hypothetical protein [Spirosoma aerolatum]|uniref:hypothetical protein n=1 Tax=Spirosoma aerolatum TaxID=1211326 RepID=UPI0009ADDE50|nr:hypothetical protein [Spirosoma aerolatum]